jgi:N-acetylglucosaminyl-diphospho-decaprenol L-rhamnosyltransferase
MNSILPSNSPWSRALRPIRPRVSVVMVVYQTGEALVKSIRHVLAEPLVDEFIIVDNGSPAEEAERLRALGRAEARVVLQQGHGNIGFARGANLGAETARGEYIVFLNPDANLQPGCIEALISAFEDQPVPTVVGARVMNTDGTEQRGGRRGEVTPFTTLLSFGHLTARQRPGASSRSTASTRPCPRGRRRCRPSPAPASPCVAGTSNGWAASTRASSCTSRTSTCAGAPARPAARCCSSPPPRSIHLGHTSLEHPVKVEFHKGVGLSRYFIKRADTVQRYVIAVLLAPAILLMSVSRPLIWKVTGRPI